jgi:hypothetical protein
MGNTFYINTAMWYFYLVGHFGFNKCANTLNRPCKDIKSFSHILRNLLHCDVEPLSASLAKSGGSKKRSARVW